MKAYILPGIGTNPASLNLGRSSPDNLKLLESD